MLKLNTKLVNEYITNDEMTLMQPFVSVAHNMIEHKTGAGNDFLGWVDLPLNYDKEEFARIKEASSKINNDSEVLLVIGIGGSYLGAKAVIDFLSHHFANSVSADVRKSPEIYFAGHNISSSYIKDLEDVIAGRDFSINIISKSGTTTEPALAFRHFKKILVEKYGETAANERIYATTDASRGALKEQADINGWETFVVPDSVGGRFSVLTAVGLLPICVSGADIDQLMSGAQLACNEFKNEDVLTNDCYKYAVIRNGLYNKGKSIEMLVGYEPTLQYFNEWWKQLFGESEGKDNKGIFPASVIFSTDLHSMGQYIQDGRRDLFETVISIKNVRNDITIEPETVDGDGLNYLAGKTISYVNNKAFEATAIAHSTGNVPNIILELEAMDAKSLGYMIYFFEKACAISGYISGINPFDQPGVEEYKKNMFALLGKPGFEDLKAELEAKL
jgi:glucose-6-phosphate isomerase